MWSKAAERNLYRESKYLGREIWNSTAKGFLEKEQLCRKVQSHDCLRGAGGPLSFPQAALAVHIPLPGAKAHGQRGLPARTSLTGLVSEPSPLIKNMKINHFLPKKEVFYSSLGNRTVD